MPIRLYFPIGNLPFQFKIPAGYASNFFATITVFLIRKLKPLIYWRTPEQTLSYKHLHFSGDFNKIEEGIGDCTKQCNQRSSNPKVQYQTYSTYKSHSTVKKIFICTKSVWTCFFVLFDKKFNVQDLFLQYKEAARMPPFVTSKR